MKDLLLTFLLAVIAHAPGVTSTEAAPAAAIAPGTTLQAPITVTQLLGTWVGTNTRGSAPATVCEVAFSPGPRRNTVTAHFRFTEANVVRRQGTIDGDALHFGMPGGGSLVLRLTAAGRLEGAFGGLPSSAPFGGTLDLERFRRIPRRTAARP